VFHVKPRRTKFITLVYVPGAIHNPKLMLTHSKGPNFVVNAAFFLSSGVIPTSQYALLASSFASQMFNVKFWKKNLRFVREKKNSNSCAVRKKFMNETKTLALANPRLQNNRNPCSNFFFYLGEGNKCTRLIL
jgi:hypothetical protein